MLTNKTKTKLAKLSKKISKKYKFACKSEQKAKA